MSQAAGQGSGAWASEVRAPSPPTTPPQASAAEEADRGEAQSEGGGGGEEAAQRPLSTAGSPPRSPWWEEGGRAPAKRGERVLGAAWPPGSSSAPRSRCDRKKARRGTAAGCPSWRGRGGCEVGSPLLQPRSPGASINSPGWLSVTRAYVPLSASGSRKFTCSAAGSGSMRVCEGRGQDAGARGRGQRLRARFEGAGISRRLARSPGRQVGRQAGVCGWSREATAAALLLFPPLPCSSAAALRVGGPGCSPCAPGSSLPQTIGCAALAVTRSAERAERGGRLLSASHS